MADAQAAAGVGRKEDAHAATAKRVQAADAYMRLLQVRDHLRHVWPGWPTPV
jgi:hypothetical protein